MAGVLLEDGNNGVDGLKRLLVENTNNGSVLLVENTTNGFVRNTNNGLRLREKHQQWLREKHQQWRNWIKCVGHIAYF